MSLTETLLQAEPRKFSLWPSVWKLLRLRVRIWWNALKRSKLRNKIGTGALLFFVVAAMLGLFFLSSWLLRFLQSPRLAEYIDPTQFLAAIPTMVLTMAFFLTIMTNFGVLLQALYLSRDMDFLVTSPIPMRAVFLAKLLEAILPNFALFCAFSLPVLFGLGTGSGYSLLYYPLLLAMLALLALAAGGMAAILVMAVVRVVPARRVAEVLGVLGAMASVLCGQTGNLINAANINQTNVRDALNVFASLNTPWSPLAWAGRGLTAIGHGNWLAGLPLSLVTLALAGGIFAGALFLAEQLYYTGWSSMQGSARRKRAPKPALAQEAVPATQTLSTGDWAARQTGLPVAVGVSAVADRPASAASPALSPATGKAHTSRFSPLLGLVTKDFLLLRRDPRNFSQLITPLIVGFVMLFSTRGGGRNAMQALNRIGVDNLSVYALIALSLFVAWLLMFNLSTLAFTREGRNYWLLKTTPIRPLFLIAGKFIVSYLPSVIFSLVYMLLAYFIRGLDLSYYPYSALVVALCIAGATGISLAFGVAGANLEWDSPNRQRMRGWTGCLVVIAVSAFLLLDLIFFLGPPILWQVLTHQIPLLAYILGIVIGTAASGLCIILPLWSVLPRMARIGE